MGQKAAISSKTFMKVDVEPTYVLDICSGFHPVQRIFSRPFISIDMMPEKQALSTLSKELQSRLRYHSFDVDGLNTEELKTIWAHGQSVFQEHLTHVHWSPRCSTMTSADLGQNSYRRPDSSAVLGTLAEEHDRIFNKVATMVVRTFPNALYTVENPSTGVFRMQPQVREALELDHGWQLLETHYCRAIDPELDGVVGGSGKVM